MDNAGKITQFELVYKVPYGLHSPHSLRRLLQEPIVSLDERFQLSRSLARSVMFMHTSGFVHKNIRPETIIVFQRDGIRTGIPFLVGFERFRPAAAGTTLQGDDQWERNLYRHPKRQGTFPEDLYVMQHDIYSLGVCLLEIGLWSSFVSWSSAESSPRPGPELDIGKDLAMEDKIRTAFNIKRHFLAIAEEKLPSRMGFSFTDIAISCLNCLDVEETNLFGKEDDLQDQDGIVVGVQYIEKVNAVD
jgi:serine/threonine protein kinase